MKRLSNLELLSLKGGWADPEKCQKLQEQAHDMENDSDTTDQEWDDWAEDFDRYCLGIL